MRSRFTRILLPLLVLAAAPPMANVDRPMPGFVRVRLVTSDGPMVLALDAKRAPITVANFMRYVDDGRFDGTTFYRASRRPGRGAGGFIEGGTASDLRRSLPPIALEPTNRTGIHHVDGTISMARYDNPASATGNFSILVGPSPDLDAHGRDQGYAAFGHVVAGIDVVKRILAGKTGGGADAMKGEMILHPVRIVAAQRLDGRPQPTTAFKAWLIGAR